jgi:hypothetical protein
MRLHRSREGMDTILMSVIVHRFTPNLKGTVALFWFDLAQRAETVIPTSTLPRIALE